MSDETEKEQLKAEQEFGEQIKTVRNNIHCVNQTATDLFKANMNLTLSSLKSSVACRKYKIAYAMLASLSGQVRNAAPDTDQCRSNIEGAIEKMYEILDTKIWGCRECCESNRGMESPEIMSSL